MTSFLGGLIRERLRRSHSIISVSRRLGPRVWPLNWGTAAAWGSHVCSGCLSASSVSSSTWSGICTWPGDVCFHRLVFPSSPWLQTITSRMSHSQLWRPLHVKWPGMTCSMSSFNPCIIFTFWIFFIHNIFKWHWASYVNEHLTAVTKF